MLKTAVQFYIYIDASQRSLTPWENPLSDPEEEKILAKLYSGEYQRWQTLNSYYEKCSTLLKTFSIYLYCLTTL